MSAVSGVADLGNPFGYPAPVWQRFRAPAHTGSFPADTPNVLIGEARTPASRARLRLELRFDVAASQARVAEARFRVYGCPTSIAVGDWLAEWVLGRTRAELAILRAAALRAALEIGEDRAHCAVMGEDAIRALLAQPELQR